MAGYCLKNGRIQEAWGEDAAGRELAAVFHLTAGLLIRSYEDHLAKFFQFFQSCCDPSSAGQKTSECRQLHICMIIKYQ